MAIQEVKTSALDELRAQTTAIASAELRMPEHEMLIEESIALAEDLHLQFLGVNREQLAVEVAILMKMVKLQLRIVPYITGCVHIQTNPFYSYSVPQTVENGKRIVKLFAHLHPDLPTSRICIKIPSTWEGMMACKILEGAGIKTLATTLFTMEQGILAAEVGCTYVAPYVNDLRVHFDPTFRDDAKLFDLCLDLQRYYERHGCRTQVLPASLTSVDEVMMLAGAHHITVGPALLRQLFDLEVLDDISIFGQPYSTAHLYSERQSYVNDEARYRMAFTRNGKGVAEEKLIQAINIFCDMQTKMELLMRPEQEVEAV
ncbi:MAG: hypothetical protein M1818_004303 [Claussenomyces sp. TS43310]|nr:MAG: hypothetical protein M1818_004303 [Claussenomyces sp. TS43310]